MEINIESICIKKSSQLISGDIYATPDRLDRPIMMIQDPEGNKIEVNLNCPEETLYYDERYGNTQVLVFTTAQLVI